LLDATLARNVIDCKETSPSKESRFPKVTSYLNPILAKAILGAQEEPRSSMANTIPQQTTMSGSWEDRISFESRDSTRRSPARKITGESAQEVALPKSLFTDYNVSEELPKQDGTKDFEIK
jgi:hypothetical protein